MNIETWYIVHRATVPNNFFEAEDLLMTMPITTRAKQHVATVSAGEGGSLSVVPIASLNYVILFATKILAVSSGTYTLSFITTSASDLTLYVMSGQGVNPTTVVISADGGSVRSHSLNLDASVEYTFVCVQSNTSMNNTVFIQTEYSGQRLPRNRAYTGGNGTILKLSSSTFVAVGDIKMSARSGDFDGWLKCDGRAVYRDAYPTLFAVIGTSFGSGNGSTTFNVPDARGRVAGTIGQGSGLTSRNIGNHVGAETHVLAEGEMPSHTHEGATAQVGSHSHTYNDAFFAENRSGGGNNNFGTSADTDGDNTMYWRTANGGSSENPADLATGGAGAHDHAVTIAATGGGGAHNNMQPTLFIGNTFICAEV